MMILQDLLPILYLRSLEDAINRFSGAVFEKMSTSLSDTSCNSSSGSESEACRDDATALTLKLVAMACILLAGVVGVGLPLVGKNRRLLRTDGNLFFAAKAFAAGVILATGFVHMLPGATSDLTDSCLPEYPWLKFPFAGFIAMTSALATLVVDFLGTQYYENKKRKEDEDNAGRAVTIESGLSSTSTKAFLAKEGGVILHAHSQAAQHNHGQDGHEGHVASHSHVHGVNNDEVDSGIRHVVVSQVLELGIVSHSVIIGLSLGVSQSPCTIRPLMAALSFHQFFEGFALGGCISQAQFKTLSTTIMACFFSITTPAGIGLGICVSSFYNGNSPRALIMEGTLDAISAGILVYMALVDLIAADFLSNRMSGNVRLQLMSYFALFLGAGLMSMLAIWA